MHTFTATGEPAASSQRPLRQHGHRLKAALGALVFPLQRARWQAFIAGTPGLAALAQVHPSLLYKIYRPSMAASTSARRATYSTSGRAPACHRKR